MKSLIYVLRSLGRKFTLSSAERLINLVLAFAAVTAFTSMAKIATNCESPFFLQTSPDMQPLYSSGDLLVLNCWNRDFQLGDVVLYDDNYQSKHRLRRIVQIEQQYTMMISSQTDGKLVVTKGDNMPVDDRYIYRQHQKTIKLDRISKIAFSIPFVGLPIMVLTYNIFFSKILLTLLIVLWALTDSNIRAS